MRARRADDVRTPRDSTSDRVWFPGQPSTRSGLGRYTLGISLLSRNSPLYLVMCNCDCGAFAPRNDCDASLGCCHTRASRTPRVGRPHRSRSVDHSECCRDGPNWAGCSGQTKGAPAEWINTLDNCDLDLDYGSAHSFQLCSDGAPRRLAALPNNTKDRGFVDPRRGAVGKGGRT